MSTSDKNEMDRARLHAMASRYAKPEPSPVTLSVGQLILQPQTVQIIVQQQDINLTPTINVQPANIHVEPTPINIAAPNVEVHPQITVQAPSRKISFTRLEDGTIEGCRSEPL